MNNSAANEIDFPRRMVALEAEVSSMFGDHWSMMSPQAGPLSKASDADTPDDNPYAIGAKRSWVPVIGEIVWRLPQALAVPFSAYTCQASNGQRIGYARMPHYKFNEYVVDAFADEVIARFEDTTEAMVFDQVNNPGGDMFRMYGILSTLTDRPLALPKHQISIDEEEEAKALRVVTLAEAGNAVPSYKRPSPELVAYSRVMLLELKEGRGRGIPSNPLHLSGVAEIMPAKIHYTKRIVVLMNELTFSAPEFLAAILQDNKRATLFGERTAGAGGCVRQLKGSHNELFGIDYITVTWTLAWRTNGQPIENIGVQPDVRYSKTVEDLQSGYAGYRRALLSTISA